MTTEMSNVHEAMQSAIFETQNESQMVNASCMLPEHVKKQAIEICGRHGVSLSAFLRHCCILLVHDYGGIGKQ